MLRFIKYIGSFLIIIFIIICWYGFPIISGYGAKVMCSDVFVSHRDPENIRKIDLGFFPFSYGKYVVHYEDSSVTGSFFGLAIKKAIYRTGLGATLINGISEQQLRSQPIAVPFPIYENHTNVLWPNGDSIIKIIPSEINSRLLDSAADFCFKEKLNNESQTRALIILYKGNIILEKYAPGYNSNSVLNGWSMSKSVINALLGILVKNKKVDINATPVFPDWKNDPRNKISITDLMHMNSGLMWWEFYAGPSNVTNMLFDQYDMGKYALRKSSIAEPGKVFNYSSGTANILSYKIRRVLGDSNYYHFPAKELFHKIGMYQTILEPDASGTFIGSSFCYATARDWARFGLLYLQDGIWNGERILPEGWVKFSTSTSEKRSDKIWGKYGSLWWVNKGDSNNSKNRRYPDVPEDCFSAMGFEGQNIWIIPSKDLVVVRLSCEHDNKLDGNQFLVRVINSISK